MKSELIGKKFPVLSDGFVCLMDVMGTDADIVQAARTSYGKGTKSASDDRTLIRYLMRHRHTTPTEMAELKFMIRIPMDANRQLVRHRTACLAGNVSLVFEQPCDGKAYRLTVKEVYDKFQATEDVYNPESSKNHYFKRDSVQLMSLRCLNEETNEPTTTSVVDIWESGVKEVFAVRTAEGDEIRCSALHQISTPDGWKLLRDISVGDAVTVIRPQVGCESSASLTGRSSVIASITSVGEEMTYDLEVAGPWHNFSADNIVVHNSINEYSTRYSEAIDEMDVTPEDGWRSQSIVNKQGSGDGAIDYPESMKDLGLDPDMSPGRYLSRREHIFQEQARIVYKERLDFGVAREQARKDLPLSTYTELFWKIDLKNLLHFLGLRMEAHAQLEIRQYATIIGEQIVKPLFPATWEAFCDYHFNAVSLSAPEQLILQKAISRMPVDSMLLFRSVIADMTAAAMTGERNRERDEATAKFDKLFA